jgi:Emfourin
MGTLKIERLGGLAGFGLPGSKLKSSGEQDIAALSTADQASLEALFRDPAAAKGSKHAADTFRYRLTRTKEGKDQTVEVPESAVPEALKTCVTDKLL